MPMSKRNRVRQIGTRVIGLPDLGADRQRRRYGYAQVKITAE